jgi:hypothetical protein
MSPIALAAKRSKLCSSEDWPIESSSTGSSADSALLRYEPNPKHKRGFSTASPPRRLAGASLCPSELCETDALEMLVHAYVSGFVDPRPMGGYPRHVYAFRDGTFFRADRTSRTEPIYHGCPVEPVEVPTGVKRRMRDLGVLTQPQYRKFCSSIR